MGNLLQVLGGKKKGVDASFFVDFENAQPTDAEREAHDKVAAVLDRSAGILGELEGYGGAGDSIRAAISRPSDEEAQTTAWQTVCPLVGKLKSLYDYSSELDSVLPVLLHALCADNPKEKLEQCQALAKQCAEVLSFVLKFDDLKMNNPAIQNDFSYYRRTLSRKKMKDPNCDEDAVVTAEEANRMSLFYAYPTPMLKCISEATTKFVSDFKEIDTANTPECLAIMANITRIMVETPEYVERFKEPETVLFCQRVMVASVILYDHVHFIGAFSKKNNVIDMKATVKAIKMHNNPSQDSLLNALRYTTKHLNDDDTPKAIKTLLA